MYKVSVIGSDPQMSEVSTSKGAPLISPIGGLKGQIWKVKLTTKHAGLVGVLTRNLFWRIQIWKKGTCSSKL